MKLTNIQGITFINAVNGSLKGKRLPVHIAFVIKQNYALIWNNQVKPYEELRKELLKKRSEEEVDNEKFNEELEKLLAEESKLNVKTIELSEFERIDADPSYDKLSVNEIDALAFMIKE